MQTFSVPSELSKESHTDHDELSLPYFYVANRGHRAPGAPRLNECTLIPRDESAEEANILLNIAAKYSLSSIIKH